MYVVVTSLLLCLLQSVICVTRIDPLVNTNVGLIRGLRASDGDYAMFLGIPYGKVNVEKPFGDAMIHPPFEDIFEAYNESPVCAQSNYGILMGSLDCLTLNIYVPPTATSNNRLPVMVYIYGGAFMRKHGHEGRETQSPKYLVNKDVIVVTINYRVGVYGFLCLDTPEAPGNQGLKDQYLALQWIQDNLGAFGADVDKITVFGTSAGGHSIDLHFFSDRDILFNKIILQSGSAQAGTLLFEPDKDAAFKIANHLGFVTNDINQALEFLSTVDSDLVVTAATDLDIIFKPCIENEYENVDSFLTRQWVDADPFKVRNIPVMLGHNRDEMALQYTNKDDQFFQNLNIVSDLLNQTFDFDEETFTEMKNAISHFYFGDEEYSEKIKDSLIEFDSDFTYNHPVHRTIKYYLENNAARIYYFIFSYIGSRNVVISEDETCCVSHSDELIYLFVNNLGTELTATDKNVIESMTTMWTNFAKYSDPTPETSELIPVKWIPLTKENYYYMNIASELEIKSRPNNKRMEFWNLFYKYNKKFQRLYKEL